MLIGTEEMPALAHAFTFRNVHATVRALHHPFGGDRVGSGLMAPARAPVRAFSTRPGQRTAHPPDHDENENEDQKIAHGEMESSETGVPILSRTWRHTARRRSQAAASVASFFAKHRRTTRSSRPSAKKADTGIAATPISRVRVSTKTVSGSSEIAP